VNTTYERAICETTEGLIKRVITKEYSYYRHGSALDGTSLLFSTKIPIEEAKQ
jgi:hypothetical protein